MGLRMRLCLCPINDQFSISESRVARLPLPKKLRGVLFHLWKLIRVLVYSKPVARHFNLPNHTKNHMAVCGLSLHLGNTESRKNIEQKFIFQIGTLSSCGINERFSFL